MTAKRTRHSDEGVSLIEVLVAFVVLIIALIPLSYLFTTSLIQAGQSTNQQTALSIAETWTETLSNVTPPVNDFGAVAVDSSNPPAGPAPTTSGGTITSASNNKALNAISSFTVSSTNVFQPATAANQTVQINTNPGGAANIDYVKYSNLTVSGTTLTFTCTTSPCSQSTDLLATNDPVTQTTIVTPSVVRGGTTYALKATYQWTTSQNTEPAGQKPNLCASGTPQLLRLQVKVSWGPNADANSVYDNVIINYPPGGVQTLGFIALQMQGDTNAYDTQSPSAPWSSRVQAPTVTISGSEPTFSVNPDSYGCVFAQVQPGNYTVTVGQATVNNPAGTTYGSAGSNPFVANATGFVTNHVWSEPTGEGNTTALCGAASGTAAAVSIGAVTRLQLATPQSVCFSGFDQSSTFNLSYPSTSTVEDGVACPGTTQIVCVTTGENGSGAVATWLNGTTWSNAVLPSGLTRIAAFACPSTTACIGVGYGTGGAVILHGTAGTTPPTLTADSLPSVANLNVVNASLTQVVCPSSNTCVASGSTSTGSPVLLTGSIGVSAATDTWTSDSLPGTVTSLNSLVCPSTANGCAAIATTTTVGAPIVVSGPSGAGSWSAWTVQASGATSFTDSALSQVACTTAVFTTCLAIGTGKINGGAVGPIVVSGLAGGSGLAAPVPWVADTLTGSVTALNQIICPISTKCLVSGANATGAIVFYGATAGTLKPETLTGAPISITQIVCPSGTACLAIGTNASGPVILNGLINATPATADTWTVATITGSSATALSQVVCSSATTCVATGTGTNGSNQPQGYLLSTSNGSSWSPEPITPSSDYILYFDDIDCTAGASGTCSAAGATPTGAVILTTTSGPAGTWSDTTPVGSIPVNSAGYVTNGVPIELNAAALTSPYTNAVTYGLGTNVSTLPNIYPLAQNYAVFAGDCQAEAASSLYNVTNAATQPGGSTNVAVPLGLLAIQVLHATSGLPYAAATLTIKSATAGCTAGESYALQPAGADGLSRTEVPYGSYTLYLNGSATSYGSVVVGGNSVTLTAGTATTRTLPTPVTASA